jgi:hypothetical protein
MVNGLTPLPGSSVFRSPSQASPATPPATSDSNPTILKKADQRASEASLPRETTDCASSGSGGRRGSDSGGAPALLSGAILGVAVGLSGLFSGALLRGAADVVRLLKKLNGLPYDGEL